MADHMRQQITAAAVAALTGLSTTGARVYPDRDTAAKPLVATELPGLVIVDDGEPAEIVTLGRGRLLERKMALRVDAHVKSETTPAATLNAILKECEIALASANLAGAKFCTLAEVRGREVSEASETKTVRQSFVFEVNYITSHTAPDVAL
jgi:hypothetical protein